MPKLFLLFLALTLSAAHAEPSSQKFISEYRAYRAGVRFANLTMYVEMGKDNFRFTATMEAAGIASLFMDSTAIITSDGKRAADGLVTEHLQSRWRENGEVKSVQVKYEDGVPISFVSDYVATGEETTAKDVSIKTVGKDTIHPFPALLVPMPNGTPVDACVGTRKLFDGRRLALLQSHLVELWSPEDHDFVVRGPVAECEARWIPIGGYSQRSVERAQNEDPAQAHFAALADTGFAAPVRIQFDTRFGILSIVARKFFEPTDAPPPEFDLLLVND